LVLKKHLKTFHTKFTLLAAALGGGAFAHAWSPPLARKRRLRSKGKFDPLVAEFWPQAHM
jgi:hypothetical protein